MLFISEKYNISKLKMPLVFINERKNWDKSAELRFSVI